ncbi:ATP-grasp domain-containing protein [Streptomyces sp. MUM 178J]|uniref:ATP-grasp domain-containing protein n=1 Tax=Streptomyces sp. MUM 178J TaxID=2791991 RepID=UPI001F050503|nr:ATP-grasp domain-containing protein [Streptomyces sp. MUM 178J]WRQ81272.1 ATP-grasp domain-containing protein [Streptomyces sp. MUM 178J]
MQRHVILVDPYSGAAEYAKAFRERGIEPVAVLSTPGPLDSYRRTWAPDSFLRTHFFDGDFGDLVATVKSYDPVAVVPGNESAVMLVDRLVAELMPGSGNVLELSEARRDKWPMARAVAEAGIPHLRQIATADPREVAAWITDSGLEGRPLVLKPRRSGGTDDVHKVAAGEDWRPYFDRLLGSVNRFDIRNDTVLVQEFADGAEYIVDTYSVDGAFGVVSVSRYSKSAKNDRIGIYDALDYLSPQDPVARELAAYTRRVAEAVGVRNGSTHTEIVLTDEGPRLIEIAARLAGSCLQYSARLATGDSQIDRTVRHCLDGAFTPGYDILRPVRVVWLSSPRAGTLRNAEALRAAEGLETFHRLGTPYASGDPVPCTEDLFTSLGWVILGGRSQEAVDADTARVKEIEAQLIVEP